MDAVRELFGNSARNSKPVEVDVGDIFPTSVLDDTRMYRQIMLAWTFCFNDVLDAEKLHSSLSRLLEIGDWKKLGGRLRLNHDGRLEIHVPKVFTPQRPAVAFTQQVYDMSILEHPLAKKIPKPSQNPSIQPGSQDFVEFAVSPETPVTVYDLLQKDIPQISLRITSFDDATLVALAWPHTLLDALGIQVLLEAWSLVLSGRESEVPPILGAREDCVIAAAESKSEEGQMEVEESLHIAPKRLKGLRLVSFGLRFIWSLLWNGTCQSRTVFLPQEAVARLRNRSLKEAEAAAESIDEKPFVSEGDVLTSWVTKIIASSEPRERPVTICSALNLRFWLKPLMQSTGVYAQNLTVASFAFLSSTTARTPVGEIAAANRRHLLEQSTEPQLKALLRDVIDDNKKGDATFIFGESNMLLVVATNWTKAKIMTAADFGAAVVRYGDTAKSRVNKPGTMTFFLSSSMKSSIMTRNIIRIVGKDQDGNYWLSGMLLPRAWTKMEEEFKML